jgi:protocatechuate 3,4-dioxygenase beta subunit
MFPVQKMRVALFLAISAISLPACMSAQAGKGIPGSVEGRVVCEDGTPARFARVYLHRAAPAPDDENTFLFSQLHSAGDAPADLSGNYVIPSVAPGTYFIRVYQQGYAEDAYLIFKVADQLNPDQQNALLATVPQVIVKGGAATHADLAIRRGGAIGGRISFDDGGAFSHVQVLAALVSSTALEALGKQDGNISITPDSQLFQSGGYTDDRGIYRISGLPQGKYRVSVRVTNNGFNVNDAELRRLGGADLTVYPPDTLKQAETKLVDVDAGDEITGVDITIPLGKLHSVRGFVTSAGVPLENARVEILPQAEITGTPSKAQHPGTLTLPDGSYRFELIPSGTYTIRVRYTAKGDPNRTAGRQITVIDNDTLDANVDLVQGKQ